MKYLEELNQQDITAFEGQGISDREKDVIYEKSKKNKNKYFAKAFILYFQIFGGLITLVAIVALKQLNPSVFVYIKEFYNEKINTPIFQNFSIKKSMENVDEKFFNKLHRKFILKNQDNEILKENNGVLLTVPVSKPLNEGSVTSRFGIRKDPFTFQDKHHSGLDIGANNGEIIHAILPGTVLHSMRKKYCCSDLCRI